MNRIETIKILSVLESAYPNFYKNDKQGIDVPTLWQELFSEENYNDVALTVKEYIQTEEYPPTIAHIKNKMYEIAHRNEPSNMELWDKLLKAIRNGYYGCEEEFYKLPSEVQEYLKNPRQLQELASMDSNTIHSVVKGQFLKQIEIIKKQKKEINMMLPETRKMIFGNDDKLLGD